MPKRTTKPAKKAAKTASRAASKSQTKQRTGRPTAYKPEFVAQAAKLCVLAATDLDIADFFGITARTLYRWKLDHPEFCQALKAGKEAADDRVERSLYHRATGYTHDAVKILQHNGKPVIVEYREHVPPDTTAAIFWLKNRQPDKWREKKEVEHTGHLTVQDNYGPPAGG